MKFRMFAGPNGSGKTSLVAHLSENYNIGIFINADMIESDFKETGLVDINKYASTAITQTIWDEKTEKFDRDGRFDQVKLPKIKVTNSQLQAEQNINSYDASIVAEFFREIALEGRSTFSFETVMSHHSKVDFLKKVSTSGYKTYLYFICTQDPAINIQRIENRVNRGQHDVPREKVVSRYYRSLGLLKDAFLAAERAFVLDNTTSRRSLVVEKNKEDVIIHTDFVPDWINEYLLDQL